MSDNPSEVSVGRNRLLVLYPAALVPGMILVLPGSVLPSLMDVFGLEKPAAGYISSFLFAGALTGMLLVSDLVRRLGARGALVLSSTGVALGLAAMSIAHDYAVLLAFFLFVGIFFGIIVTLPGVVISSVMGTASGRAMNLVYSFFALGVMATPLAAGELLKAGWAWWTPFLLPVLPAVIAVALAFRFDLPPMRPPSGLSAGVIRELLRSPALFVGGLAAILLYVASEATVGFWAPKYLSECFPSEVDLARASRVLTWFWAGQTVGRVASAQILKRIAPAHYLLFLLAAGGLTTVIAPHLTGPAWVEAAFGLAGLWFAGMYPTLVGYTGKLGPRLAPLAFSLMTASGQVGAMTLPPVVGYAALHIPFSWAMSLVGAPLLALGILVTGLKIHGVY